MSGNSEDYVEIALAFSMPRVVCYPSMSTQLPLLLSELIANPDPLAVRRSICALEYQMGKLGADQVLTPKDLPTEHVFAPGVYLRTVFLTKGETWIGKIHRHSHGNIVSQGAAAVVTEFGAVIHRAHEQFVSPAYTKRALVILEDTIWTCVHANPDNVTDLDELESMFIAPSYTELGMYDPVLELLGE